MPKKVKRIWNIITTLILLIVVILAILMAGGQLLGMRPFAVLSGSMEPAYPVGSLIYVKATDFEDIKVGDAITFVFNEDLDVVTHRVYAIADAENQLFQTKGDANATPDGAPVHYKNVVGVVQYSIPYLGYIADFVTQPPGMIVAIIGGVILLILIFLPDVLDKMDESDAKSAAKKAAKQQAAQPEAEAEQEETVSK